jgi:hypothetical protein
MTDVPMATCSGLQCDDFESGDLSAWGIHRSESGLTVEVSTLQAHSGAGSVRAFVPALTHSGASAYLFRASPTPQSTGVMAARAWIFAPGDITDFSGVLQFRSAAAYAILTGDSNKHWTVTELTTTGMLVDHRSTAVTEAARWTCVELDYAFAPPHVELYVDDARVLEVAMADPAPAYSEVGIGVTRAPLAGFQVFVDDVVIANAHIGCN